MTTITLVFKTTEGNQDDDDFINNLISDDRCVAFQDGDALAEPDVIATNEESGNGKLDLN